MEQVVRDSKGANSAKGFSGEAAKVKHLAQALFFLLSVACALPVSSQSVSPPTPIGAEHENAIPVRTGLPVEPLPDLKAGESVELRVSGVVTKDGRLDKPEIVASENAKRFADALQSVLADWRFQPAVDEDLCTLKDKAQVFSVWFESKEGKTVMSVSSRVTPRKDGPRHPGWRMGWESPPHVVYPWAARSLGMEGRANLLISVNADGSLGVWNVLSSDPHGVFAAASVASLLDAKFKAWEPAEGEKQTLCVTLPFQYCIGKDAKIPHRDCKNVAE